MSLKKLGRYDLIRVLGKGAMGLVYEGRDPNLDRRVAIKTIKVENLSDEAAADYEIRFRTEARSAARLQHPNIVSVYDSDRDIDIAYLVMEFIQGDDLKHHLDKGQLYSLEQTLGIMTDLLSALDYAHRQNIVHRDIKPANLLIEADGRVKLTDFGVARIQDSGDMTRTQGSIVGTLKYMSPEQVQGRPVDARADLFAAGIVLYQLLTGRRPFDGDSDFITIQQIVNHTPAAPTSFNDRLPPAFDTVISKALAKSRDQRYASAQDFSRALREAVREASDPTIVPPLRSAGRGPNATWTGTVHASEAITGLQSNITPTNTGTNTGSIVTQELELVYWKDVKDSVDPDDLEVFLAKFPSGIYADLARRRLKKLLVSTGGSDDGDTGLMSSPTATQVMPRAGDPAEQTVPMTRAGNDARPGSSPSDSPSLGPDAWKTLQAASLQAAPSAAAPAAVALTTSLPADADATVLEPRGASPVASGATRTAAAPPLAGAPAAAAAVAAPAYSAPGTAVPPAKPAASSARLSTPSARKVTWVLAGLVGLVLVGAGIAFLRGGSGGADGNGVPAPLAAASSPAASVPALPASVPAATVPPPAVVSANASAPAVAASAPRTAASAAAARKAAAAKVIADKASNAVSASIPENETRAERAERIARAAPSSASEGSAGHPETACEGRMLLGFQICVSQQCAKPAFAHHAVCVKRRAQEQQRRESEMMRN
ncbi:MAG: serine/threonine-protein kinase [Polaromonas sp.]|nr:serine/threonine-protein kinase [Polaromonas sp.]